MFNLKDKLAEYVNILASKAITGINVPEPDIWNAKIAGESYITPNLRAKIIGAYVLDEKENNENSCVYINATDKQAIIWYRGTANMNDVKNDAEMVLDVQWIDPRIKNALETYDTVQRNYQGYAIRVCWHSLGGTISYIVAKHRNPARCVAFNPGVRGSTFFLQMLEDTIRHKDWAKNTYTYKILWDIVSMPAFVGHTKVFTIKANDPLALHSMDNFLK